MNFKTISIVATATITLGAGIISLAALKKSKQILDDDDRVKMMEAEDTSVEEAIELQESIKRDMYLISQAPKVFKTYGIIALASAAILTGLIISKHKEDVSLTTVRGASIDDMLDEVEFKEGYDYKGNHEEFLKNHEIIKEKLKELDDKTFDYLEQAKGVAAALGTSIKHAWMDDKGNTMFELENPELGEEFLDLITEK